MYCSIGPDRLLRREFDAAALRKLQAEASALRHEAERAVTTAGLTSIAKLLEAEDGSNKQAVVVAVLRGKLELIVAAAAALLAPPAPEDEGGEEAATAPAADGDDAKQGGQPGQGEEDGAAEPEAPPSLPLTESVLLNLPRLLDSAQGMDAEDADIALFLQKTLFATISISEE